jgi:flagellar M-ring protein FliF
MTTASTPMPPAVALGNGADEGAKTMSTRGNADRGMSGKDLSASVTRQAIADPMALIRDLVRQPTVKKLLPLFVVLLVVAAFGLASMSMGTPKAYRPLSLVLNEADKKVAMDTLKDAGIDAKLDQNSGAITVPEDKFQDARMAVAAKGLPRTEVSGIDTLKDMPAMTTSQFMEQVRYNNAMEQELARTISQIAGIKSARVHLAAPKQSVFVRDRVPTKASVIITRVPGKTVSAANVQAIVQLVASSVPYLAPENVSVVDNYGSLMNEMLAQGPLGMTGEQLLHKQQMEDLYRTRLIQLLAPIVGADNVTAQVSLTLDFDQREVTREDFDDKSMGPKTRSEMYVEDKTMLKDAIGIPGSLSNAPPNPPVNPEATSNTNPDIGKGISERGTQVMARSTKNYEIDRQVRHVKSAMGTVQRIGVGVLINERPLPAGAKPEAAADGGVPKTTIPYTQEELDRLNQLVRGAVGFDEKRGDVVTVVSTRFEPTGDGPLPWWKDEKVANLANSGAIALLFVLFMAFVVRPMVKKLTKPDYDPVAIAAAAADAAAREAAAAERLKSERIAAAVAEAAAAAAAERARIEEEERKAKEDLERAKAEAEAAAAARAAAEAEAAARAAAQAEAERLAAEAAAAEAAAQGALAEAGAAEEMELQEGESLEELKARMTSMKPKKQSIPADLLSSANSYDDKVALIRMIVSDNSTRVASVLRHMIQPG